MEINLPAGPAAGKLRLSEPRRSLTPMPKPMPSPDARPLVSVAEIRRVALSLPRAYEAEVRGRGLALGLVDNKVCAIDEVWSGLRFVVRLADRPGRAPRAAGATRSRSGQGSS